MAESEKVEFRIRDKLIDKIFTKSYGVLRNEMMNPDIRPRLTMEEHKVIIGRFQDLFLQQQMELYHTYFFEENLKPLFENLLELIKDVGNMPKPEDKEPSGDFYV